MVIFFFQAGLEIKREMAVGELSTISKAALPVAAAIGGMVVPALIFSFFNKGTEHMAGWAIPASTDIAFSLGVAALLGKKVPAALKIFLVALAIMDDLCAIVIIALFYGDSIQVAYLLASLLIIGAIIYLNAKKIKFGWAQALLGIFLWYSVLNSGIHATVAGVVFAFLVPDSLVSEYEHKFYRPVYFLIVPLFALANTAIVFPSNISQTLTSKLSLGIILGLLIGKPAGIFAASYTLVKRTKASLPMGINWSHIIGIGLLAGIGFTMSIFISSLAFGDGKTEDTAKIAVLTGSLIAMIAGYFWLKSVRNEKIRV